MSICIFIMKIFNKYEKQVLHNNQNSKLLKMSYIEIEKHSWFCHNDLLLVCEREKSFEENASLFMSDDQLQIRRHRFIPTVNFNDEKLFSSLKRRKNFDDEVKSELNSLLACREYSRKQNPFYDRIDDKKPSKNYQKSPYASSTHRSFSSARRKISRFHD